MAVSSNLAKHLKEDLNESGIDDCEMSEALLNCERREPFENRRARVGVGGGRRRRRRKRARVV